MVVEGCRRSEVGLFNFRDIVAMQSGPWWENRVDTLVSGESSRALSVAWRYHIMDSHSIDVYFQMW